MTEDMTFNEDLKVNGNIYGKDGARYNLKVNGNINCWNINCLNIDCWNIDCDNIYCVDINCYDISFYAFAIAYNSFMCKSWKARRENGFAKCLDREIEIKKNICEKCGKELKE